MCVLYTCMRGRRVCALCLYIWVCVRMCIKYMFVCKHALSIHTQTHIQKINLAFTWWSFGIHGDVHMHDDMYLFLLELTDCTCYKNLIHTYIHTYTCILLLYRYGNRGRWQALLRVKRPVKQSKIYHGHKSTVCVYVSKNRIVLHIFDHKIAISALCVVTVTVIVPSD
jgi:hypothetical protein